MTPFHRLEGRSSLLAQRIIQRKDALSGMLRAPNDRALFTEHKPESEALDWWRIHRNDPLGKKVIDRLVATNPHDAPLKLAELDAALNARVEADMMAAGGSFAAP